MVILSGCKADFSIVVSKTVDCEGNQIKLFPSSSAKRGKRISGRPLGISTIADQREPRVLINGFHAQIGSFFCFRASPRPRHQQIRLRAN